MKGGRAALVAFHHLTDVIHVQEYVVFHLAGNLIDNLRAVF